MTDQALIFQDGSAPDAAGMHAIIIGVGHYWHLPNGRGPTAPLPVTLRMDQLSSPPYGARAMADFVLETYHEDVTHPLRSLSMLASEPAVPNPTFAHLLVPTTSLVDPTIANIKAAVEHWKARGDQNSDNILFFYICCHGLSAGLQHTLLASDFASGYTPTDTVGTGLFDKAIDLTEFHRSMGESAAKRQIYFVDACRVVSPDLLEGVFKGQPLVNADPITAPRASPIFYSSLRGDASWGAREKPSPFSRSIQLAFQGGSWVEEKGVWKVRCEHLKPAMENQIKRVMRKFRSYPNLIQRDYDVSFTLKVIEPGIDPLVPLDVDCSPNDANKTVSLSLKKLGAQAPVSVPPRKPSHHPWLLDVPAGMYDLTLRFGDGEYQDAALDHIIVHPPQGSKTVKVAS